MRLVAVAAHSEAPDPANLERIRRFVDLLADSCGDSLALLVGGYWGFMRVVVDEAIGKGLMVVILPPVEREDVEFPERAIVLRTGLSYRLRSVAMVRSCDVLVVLGGASGTIQELVTAYTEGKPVLLLLSGLPSDRVSALAPYLDDRRVAEIRVFDSVESLVSELCRTLAERRGGATRFG
ncbi:MAG: hypothetical protein LM571_01285 [Desulfurococcaceae archaeon]|jgi:uncharacterized protein (TIGR00725 family)|nr:hypothetical protein [Desulfurococcaceae archaeon]